MNQNKQLENVAMLKGASSIAKKTGISRSHLYWVTRGVRKPSDKLRKKLEALGVCVPEFQGESK